MRLATLLASFWLCGMMATQLKAAVAEEESGPTWIVSGTWKKSREEALQDALKKAQGELLVYFEMTKHPLSWIPSEEYIRRHLLRELPLDDAVFKTQEGKVENLGTGVVVPLGNNCNAVRRTHYFSSTPGKMHRVCVKVGLSPRARAEIESKDREYRREVTVQERMVFLARILGGLVALLGVVAGYIRLDDLTKGYYTGWLRLAAGGILAVVGVGLWLLS
jgi:hypothetical protein